MLNELFLLRMKDYLGDDFNRFLESYSKDNIRSFTINNNYISNEEFEKIFDLNIKKIPYIHNGYYLVDKDVKLGFHPLHHAGAFYMQDPNGSRIAFYQKRVWPDGAKKDDLIFLLKNVKIY